MKKKNVNKILKMFIQVREYSIVTKKYSIQSIVEPIRVLVMDNTGKYVASAGDRQIRVFHNIAG
jgi:hypothetical protein